MGKPGGRGKKNAGVGVDFKRVKSKVGKKLPRAQNHTDTSFKSHTISLAEQSMAVDREGQAVTGRNLTLKELLGQCGHYSERVRRDALQGLAELLAGHPEELRRHSALVVEAAAARVADGEASVRAAARELLGGTLLPALGGASLAPFVPLLMAHVCAAMTHLAQPIRADSLGFLELLMAARPDLVAAGFLAPVLDHFSDLLSKGSRGRSIKAGSLASLHAVAASLQRFLAAGLASAPTAAAVAEGEGLEVGGEELQAGEVLAWRRCRWPPGLAAVAAEGSGGGAADTPTGASAGGGEVGAEAAAAALLGHLLECWAEGGASQLAEAPELAAAQCLTHILRCCELLLGHWGAGLAGDLRERGSLAAALLRQVAPHFPLLRPAVPLSGQLSEQLVALNVAAAQVLARFLPAQQAHAAAAAAGGSGGDAEGAWVGCLLDWFSGVMAAGAALPASDDRLFGQGPGAGGSEAGGRAGSGGRGGEPGGRAGSGGRGGEPGLPGGVYQSALDGTLAVLPLLAPPRRRQLLSAAAALWRRSPARGAARPRVLAFWRGLLRDPAAAFYAPTPGGGPLLQHGEAAEWLAELPRYLFELGGSCSAASQAALALLSGAARSAPAGSPLAAALQGLQPQLAPLWAVLLPAAGGRHSPSSLAAAAPPVHVGPLASLPTAAQVQAVDLLYHFPAVSEQLLRTAVVVCLGDAYPAAVAVRLLGVLAARAAAGAAPPAAFCGLLLNLLSGGSAAGLQQRDWPRHRALVGAACSAALGLSQPPAVAAAMLPPLLEAARGGGSSGGSWATYGLLQLTAALASAATAAALPSELPPAVLSALPQLMLQLQAGSSAGQQAGGGDINGTSQLASGECTALCLRLLSLQPRQLLPALLLAVPGSVADDGSLLAAVLQLLLSLLREQPLHGALLQQREAVFAALGACRSAAEVAGSAEHSSRALQDQLRQAAALCTTVLGN